MKLRDLKEGSTFIIGLTQRGDLRRTVIYVRGTRQSKPHGLAIIVHHPTEPAKFGTIICPGYLQPESEVTKVSFERIQEIVSKEQVEATLKTEEPREKLERILRELKETNSSSEAQYAYLAIEAYLQNPPRALNHSVICNFLQTVGMLAAEITSKMGVDSVVKPDPQKKSEETKSEKVQQTD